MPFVSADIEKEYAKYPELKNEDVAILQEWLKKQKHLPEVTEMQLILFLHSCYFSVQRAKLAIDTFFTIRTHCTEVFANRQITKDLQNHAEVILFAALPQCTPKGYRPFYLGLIDTNADNYNFNVQTKLFDMMEVLWLMTKGTDNGLSLILDMGNSTLAHLAKLNISTFRKYLLYLQEGLPVRLKEIHVINTNIIAEKAFALIKPYLDQAFIEMIRFHRGIGENTLYEFIPKDCLPNDFGGSVGTRADLHKQMKSLLVENSDYFAMEEYQKVDESKRVKMSENIERIFGLDGTFKKLDID